MSYVRLLVGCFVGMALVACHSSDSSPRQDASATGGAANGGAGGSGGKTADGLGGSAGGMGGSAVGGAHGMGGTGGSTALDPAEVCRAAVRAQAERAVLCLGSSTLDTLMRFASACPDYAFNPDSNRTVEGLAACLPALVARTCSDVTLSIMPTCFTNGKRYSGASCVFPSQCKSGVCNGGGKMCRDCYDGAKPPGSACSVYYECAVGSYCSRGNQTCVESSTVVYADEGKPCDLTTVPAIGCVGDLYCQLTNGSRSAGICTSAPGAGKPCGSNGYDSTICTAGTTCNNGTCDVPGACGSSVKCDSLSYCAYVSSGFACAPLATVGQACSSSGADSLPPCLAPMVCGSQGTCVVPRAAGQTCSTANPCADLLMCVSGTCQPIAAASCPA